VELISSCRRRIIRWSSSAYLAAGILSFWWSSSALAGGIDTVKLVSWSWIRSITLLVELISSCKGGVIRCSSSADLGAGVLFYWWSSSALAGRESYGGTCQLI
jgi:hypothetical protein